LLINHKNKSFILSS